MYLDQDEPAKSGFQVRIQIFGGRLVKNTSTLFSVVIGWDLVSSNTGQEKGV